MKKVNQVAFQRYAKEGAFEAKQVSSANIQAEAKKTADYIKQLKLQYQQEIENNTNQLNQLSTNYQLKRQADAGNKQVEDFGREIDEKARRRQFEVDMKSFQTRADNAKKSYDAISSFSKLALAKIGEITNEQHAKNYEAGLMDALYEGVPAEELIANQIGEANIHIANEEIQGQADVSAAAGTHPSIVQSMRKAGNRAYQSGLDKGNIIRLGREYHDWAVSQFSTNNQLQVSVKDEESGEYRTITPMEAGSAEEKFAVLDQLLVPYLIENNLYGKKRAFLNPLIKQVYSANSLIVSEARKVDLRVASNDLKNKAIATFYARKDPIGFETSLRMLARTLDDNDKHLGLGGDRQEMFKLLYTGRNEDGGLHFSDSEIKKIVSSAFADQPDNPLYSRYFAEIQAAQMERQKLEGEILDNAAADERRAEQQWGRDAIKLIEDEQLGQLEIGRLISVADQRFGAEAKITKKLKSLLKFNVSEESDKQWIPILDEKAKMGDLDLTEIKRAGLTDRTQALYEQKYRESLLFSAPEAKRKVGFEVIENKLLERVDRLRLDGKNKNASFTNAFDYAKSEYKKDFYNYMSWNKGTPAGTHENAHNYAVKQFNEEFNKTKEVKTTDKKADVKTQIVSAGMYAATDTRGGVANAHFINFTVDKIETEETVIVSNMSRLRNEKANSNILRKTEFISKDRILNALDTLRDPNSTVNINTLLPELSHYAREWKTNGRQVTPMDVFQTQVEFHRDSDPSIENISDEEYKEATKITESIDPRYKALISGPYANPLTAVTAIKYTLDPQGHIRRENIRPGVLEAAGVFPGSDVQYETLNKGDE